MILCTIYSYLLTYLLTVSANTVGALDSMQNWEQLVLSTLEQPAVRRQTTDGLYRADDL